jgi:hypothetical protein
MTIVINSDSIKIGNKTISNSPTGISIDGFFNAISVREDGGESVGGFSHGYSCGSYTPNTFSVLRYSFASDANAVNVGKHEETVNGWQIARMASASSPSHGYMAGRNIAPANSYDGTIKKFPFATPSGNASTVGQLSTSRQDGMGMQTSIFGYSAGGQTAAGGGQNQTTIDRFSFASDGNGVNTGDLTTATSAGAGCSSPTHGYTIRGTLEKFSFASEGNMAIVAPTAQGRYDNFGQSSRTNGYSSGGAQGGGQPAPVNYMITIQKFPFATDATHVTTAQLTQARAKHTGSSSQSHGYNAGGSTNPTSPAFSLVIDKFSFTADTNATAVGNLTENQGYGSGHQY